MNRSADTLSGIVFVHSSEKEMKSSKQQNAPSFKAANQNAPSFKAANPTITTPLSTTITTPFKATNPTITTPLSMYPTPLIEGSTTGRSLIEVSTTGSSHAISKSESSHAISKSTRSTFDSADIAYSEGRNVISQYYAQRHEELVQRKASAMQRKESDIETLDLESDSITNATTEYISKEPSSALPLQSAPKTTPTTTSTKLTHLDGLRGWASICVFIGHVGSRICPRIFWTPDPPYYTFGTVMSHIFLGMGGFPIVVFFMLSGRVLALSFLKKKDFSRLASSAIRRPFRLVFPVYVALFFYWIFQVGNTFDPNINKVTPLINPVSGPVYEWFPPISDSLRLKNVSQFLTEPITLYLSPYNAPVNPGLSVYWTLPVEFIYSYVIFLLALTTSAITHQKWLFYSVIILIDWLNSMNSWLSPFAVGLWIAEVAQTGFYTRIEKGLKGYIVRGVLFSIGFTCVLLDAFRGKETQNWFNTFTFDNNGIVQNHDLPAYDQMLPLTLVSGACLMLLLETSSWFRFMFGNPIMEFFGKISFGVYLLHPIIVVSFGSWLVAKYFDPAAGYSSSAATAIVFLALFAAVIPCSWIFFYVADKPSIWIGRQVESVVFSTAWSRDGFNKWFNSFMASLSTWPQQYGNYLSGQVVKFKTGMQNREILIHRVVFFILGIVDIVLLIAFCTTPTQSTYTSQSIKFVSRSFRGWDSIRTLVTMGDSWTDTAFNLSLPAPTPANPIGALPLYGYNNYWGVSGTNGPNWVWGLTAQYNESLILTYNVASSGAVIDSSLVVPFQPTVQSMKNQVASVVRYFSAGRAAIDASMMVAIMLGGNDVGNTYMNGPGFRNAIAKGQDYPISQLYPEIVTVYIDELNILKNAGVKNFLLINIPPLDKSPNAVTQGSHLKEYADAIRQWNSLLSNALSSFSSNCIDCSVFYYDVNAFMNNLIKPDSAAQVGIKETKPVYCEAYSTLANQPNAVSSDCAYGVREYYWLNIVHPTWPVMNQIAQDIVKFIK